MSELTGRTRRHDARVAPSAADPATTPSTPRRLVVAKVTAVDGTTTPPSHTLEILKGQDEQDSGVTITNATLIGGSWLAVDDVCVVSLELPTHPRIISYDRSGSTTIPKHAHSSDTDGGFIANSVQA